MHRDAVEQHPRELPGRPARGGRARAATRRWSSASSFGYRNAQVTVLAPTGTIGFMMDCDTTGVEPDIALVKYKLLAGGGMLKIVNRTVPARARSASATTRTQVEAIIEYIDEHDTIEGAPGLQRRAPAGVRLRLQAAQRQALHPLPGAPAG